MRDESNGTPDYVVRLDSRKAAASVATLVSDDDPDTTGLDDVYPDLFGDDLTGPVIAQQDNEFRRSRCFLVQHRSWHARTAGHGPVCRDCA